MEDNKKQLAPGAQTAGETSQNYASRSNLTGTDSFTIASIVDRRAATELTARQLEILAKRGINTELAVKLGWRNAGRKDTGDWLAIPYFKNGKEVNCKFRTLSGDKKFYQVEAGENCLYNVDILKNLAGETLVITEGEFDAAAALDAGFLAVSVPNGAPKEAIGDKDTPKYDYLSDISPDVKKIILAVDGDNPGANLFHDLSLRLGRHRCLWIKYPAGCKDLNDILMQHGRELVFKTLASAQFTKIDGLYKMSELPPLPNQDALEVGIKPLEEHFKLRVGDFSVVTGIPSHGKTTLINNIAFNMAKNHGWNICFASFEQQPQTEHLRALRTLYHGKPAFYQTTEEKQQADKFIDDHFIFIVPEGSQDEHFDLLWLKERMAAAVTQKNVKMVIIDPWNEIDHIYNGRETSLTQYVGKAIKELKRFANKYLVHVMVIAHPAKMAKNKGGDYPVPTAYDISDSAHWYNRADQILIVYRIFDEERREDKTLVRIAKSRYHQILGKPGEVNLKFSDYTNQYGVC